MLVKYLGPSERLQQIGSTRVDIARGDVVEFDDDLAATLLDEQPTRWQAVDESKSVRKKKPTSPKTDTTPTTDDPESEEGDR